MRSTRARVILGAAVVVVVALGAGVWWFVLRDTSDPKADIDAIDAKGADAGKSVDSPDGTWKVQPGNTVFVGYRVQEQFVADVVEKTATGRTPAVEGTITVAGPKITATTFTADLTQLKSDQDRRDSALRERGIESGRFPKATFVLSSPITLPSSPAKGATVKVTAAGDLTLHGVTKPVQVALQARWDGSTISVAGNTPIRFADYGMDRIEIPGFVKTDDHGTMELQLLFVPST
jgi:polyisoprenoid-binding protein YceI